MMMRTSPLSMFIVAAPPMVGSFIVLALASVGWNVWIMQLLAIVLACCLALSGTLMSKSDHRQVAPFVVVMLTLIGLAIPLFGESSAPERWISIGPVMLYAAPFLLPSFIAACAVFVGKDMKSQIMGLAAVLGVALLLSVQPDASQVLALLAASVVVGIQRPLGIFRLGLLVVPMLLLTLYAFSLPDPLAPVPYVEEVFALGLSHSWFAGVVIIASAIALIAALCMLSVSGPFWLRAVAAYYTVLFLCSTMGITPAPLVGYGAGPILGFGLMLAVHGAFKCDAQPHQ